MSTTDDPDLDLSVVLCTAGAGRHLAAQLAALEAQATDLAWELVVVDNGSTPEALGTVRAFAQRMPRLRILAAREPRGPAHGRNAGARAARAPKVAFCDDDDVVSPGWVTAMHSALGTAELVGGRLDVTSLNTPQVQAWRTQGQTEDLYLFPGRLPFVMSCNMGVDRGTFLGVGGFDASLYPGEDVELSWRLQEAGYRVAFSSEAVVQYRYRNALRAHLKQQWTYGRSSALVKASRPAPTGHGLAMLAALARLLRYSPVMRKSAADRARHLGALTFWCAEAWTLARASWQRRRRA